MPAYQSYMYWVDPADPLTKVYCPYTTMSLDESEDVNFADDTLAADSSIATRTLGRVRYAGEISFYLTVEMANFFKKWLLTDRVGTYPYRTLVHDNSWRHYTYGYVYPVNLSLTSTAGENAAVTSTLAVIAKGEEAAGRKRSEAAPVPVGTALPSIKAWEYYEPIMAYETSFSGAGDYVFTSNQVTAWSATLTTGYRDRPGGGGAYVPKWFDRGQINATGSVELFDPVDIPEINGSDEFTASLSVPLSILGWQKIPGLWLTFHNCSEENDEAVSGSRQEARVRRIDWRAKRTETELAVS